MIKRNKIAALCTAVMLIFGSLPLYVHGAAAGANEREKKLDATINYSDGKGSYNELSVAELLRSATGITVTDAEKEYFSICEITFKYSDTVPSGSVSCKKTDDGLLITASPYSYKASNGETVNWIPASVTVNGAKKAFSGELYEASFTGLEDGENYEIKTEYKAEIIVPKSVLSTLANAGYDEGKRVINEKKAYNDALAAYERETEKYEKEYASYLKKKNEYNAYLKALSRYNAEKAEYDAYTAAKEQYEKDYAAWLAYTEAYEAYEIELADFEEKNAVYEEQYKLYAEVYAALSACRKSMEALESIFIRDSAGHTMYGTLQGDTVATVVAKRSELIEYGVNEVDIDNAAQSTNRLISVLSPYNRLKTEKERFEYYHENYKEIKSQFVRLYAALHSLANNGLVRMELSKKDKLERYYQFVAQLYVISTGLDDDVTLSDAWDVRGYTVYDVLERSQIVTDRNSADPTGLIYPENCELPEAPTRPEEPKKVDKPQFNYVNEVTKPVGPPDAVTEPKEPKKPTVTRPDTPVFTAQQLLLEAAIENGKLKQRSFSSTLPLTFRTTVSRMASYSTDFYVSFFDHDRKTLLYSEKVQSGGDVSYKGETPAREADAKNTYAFSGWVDENGDKASFTNIKSDKSFYASYTAAPVKYTVSFVLNDEKVSAEFVYGDRPVCPKEASSYKENGKEYIFDGWSPSLELVTGDTTYTAKYRENDGRFTVSFNVLGTQSDYRLAAGETPKPPEVTEKYIEGIYLYEFSGWSPKITKVTGIAVYTAEYSKNIAVPTERGGGAEVTESSSYICADCTGKGAADISKLTAYAKQEGKGVAFKYGEITVWIANNDLSSIDPPDRFEAVYGSDKQLELVFKDAAGNTPAMDLTVSVSFDNKDISAAHVYEKSADELKEISAETKDGALLLHATGNNTYTVAFSYSIHTESVGAGYVKTDRKAAEKGETVTVTVQPDLGARLIELYLTVNGEKTALDTGSFVMPGGDVTVTAVFEKTGYTIVFYDGEGKEISKQLLSYGEMPVLPDDPTKEGDEKTVYAFSGWNPEVMPATADAEYRPFFKAGASRGGDDYKTTPQTGFFTRVLPKIAGVLLLAGALTALIIVFVRKKKKKR